MKDSQHDLDSSAPSERITAPFWPGRAEGVWPEPEGPLSRIPMEFVFVVPRAELFRDHYPQGLVAFGDVAESEAFTALVRSRGFFVERETAEVRPEWKQVIPYSLVHTPDGVLLMRRLDRGGEARLHQKLSIGVGGHINPEDLTASGESDPILAGTRREVEEELVVDGRYELRTVGLLNDDSNPVGAVHVGLVQVLELTGSVKIREEDTLEGRIVPPDELREMHAAGANFETWSSVLIERLDELIPVPLPTNN